ncbi:MAG: anion permease [Chloroflexi bacterium]|nr:anion permease [Chloroflexota bacterium]
MTLDIAIVLGVLLLALLLFVTERLRIDVVALIVLVSLGMTGQVSSSEAFSGFSNPAVVTIWAVFILSGGLARTGVAGILGRQIRRLARGGEVSLILVLMIVAALLSSVMNNVGVAALLMPALMDIARRQGTSPARLLMPLAFATLLGGMLTLIGTPPNLLLSEQLAEIDPGLAFGMFDFTAVGLAVTTVGIAYMVLVGRHLLPTRDLARSGEGGEEAAEHYGLQERLFAIRLPEDSPLAGRSLAESRFGQALSLNVMAIIRQGETVLAPEAEARLRGGDRLIVKGRPATLRFLQGRRHIVLVDDDPALRSLITREIGLAKLTVAAGSPLLDRSLADCGFRDRYGLFVLELRREGEPLVVDLQYQPLRIGDVLLVQGPRERLDAAADGPDFSAVEPATADEAANRFGLGRNLFVGRVEASSPIAGRRLGKLHLDRFGLTLLGILREGQAQLLPDPESRVEAGDRLLIKSRPELLEILAGYEGLGLELDDPPDLRQLESERVGLAEVALSPQTRLVGRSLRELAFREQAGLTVLAIWREGRALRQRVKDIPLRFGDALLLYGRRRNLERLARDPDFLVLTEGVQAEPRREKAALAAGIFVFGVILPAVALDVPIALAAVFGALTMVLTGCLSMEEAYRYIQWPAVFLIAGMLPLGIAMESSGAAAWLAGGLMRAIGGYGELAIMAGLFTAAALASQVMPNPAVAVLLAPIAISAAAVPEVSVRRLMMTIAIAASSSFFSPVGHPANILVMGPGGYRFKDYLRAGLPMALVVMLVALVSIPIFVR